MSFRNKCLSYDSEDPDGVRIVAITILAQVGAFR